MAHLSILLFGLIFFSSTASATLIDLGGGLIYDDFHDITWLSDANYAKTTGYTAPDVDSSTGAMSWNAAMIWAEQLVYAGTDDWRLPTAYNQDGSGPDTINGGYIDDGKYSEMEHLFYVDLGGTYGTSIYNSTDPDLALFSNIVTYQSTAPETYDTYWTSDDGWSGRKRYFAFTNGTQWAKNPNDPNGHGWGVAWAVHDGRLSSPVPEPTTILLFGTGLLGLAGIRSKKKLRGKFFG